MSSQATVDILLVEDDHDVREMTKMILDRHGFTVRTASDGAEGYAQARGLTPSRRSDSTGQVAGSLDSPWASAT